MERGRDVRLQMVSANSGGTAGFASPRSTNSNNANGAVTPRTRTLLRIGDSKSGQDAALRPVGLFWTEKLLSLVFFLQIQGVLWSTSQAWPWPYMWLSWTRFTVLFNLDLAEFFRSDDSANPTTHMLYWSFFLAVLPAIVFGAYTLVRRRLFDEYHESRPLWINQLAFEKTAIISAQLLCTPIALALFRLGSCRSGKLFYTDTDVDCWSPVHYALLGVSLCTAVPFLVIIPWFLHRIIVQHTVFNQPPLHEKHVRSREIEYMIGVSDLYEQDRTFVFASYRRYFVYSPVVTCLQRICLAATSALLGPYALDFVASQAVLFCILIATPTCVRMFGAEFRCPSSNALQKALDWTLLANAIIGIFSSTKQQNAFLVATTLTIILAIVNVTGLALAAVATVWTLITRQEWPVTAKDVRKLLVKDAELMTVIAESKAILEDSLDCPGEFVSKENVRQQIQKLDSYRKKAQQSEHLLEWTLHDMTENLALYYQNTAKESMMPNPQLETALSGLQAALDDRENDLSLVPLVKKEMFNKLLVIRALVGDEYVYGDRSTWEESKISPELLNRAGAGAAGSGPEDGVGGRHASKGSKFFGFALNLGSREEDAISETYSDVNSEA